MAKDALITTAGEGPAGVPGEEAAGARGGASPAGTESRAIDGEEARRRAAALLEATHQFPCEYHLTVIAISDEGVSARLAEVISRIDDSQAAARSRRQSAGGKYVSHRFAVRVSGAEDVLTLYEVVKTIDGVVTVM